jgi:hypothetical protein
MKRRQRKDQRAAVPLVDPQGVPDPACEHRQPDHQLAGNRRHIEAMAPIGMKDMARAFDGACASGGLTDIR